MADVIIVHNVSEVEIEACKIPRLLQESDERGHRGIEEFVPLEIDVESV